MRKQLLLPFMFAATVVATQGAEPIKFQNMLGDPRLSRIQKPEYKISDVEKR